MKYHYDFDGQRFPAVFFLTLLYCNERNCSCVTINVLWARNYVLPLAGYKMSSFSPFLGRDRRKNDRSMDANEDCSLYDSLGPARAVKPAVHACAGLGQLHSEEGCHLKGVIHTNRQFARIKITNLIKRFQYMN